MEKEIEIGKLNDIYEKYGDLGFKIDTPYGYKDIKWCGITEENADVYRCELENGLYVEGADYHRLKKVDGDFVPLKLACGDEIIQTRNGNSPIKSISKLTVKDTLYDVQVADVHQYYSNNIVSHNTSFNIDAPLFLYFGRTTKTDRNEEIFNQFSDSDKLSVRGMIEIDDEEYIVERKMVRKLKKDGSWLVSNTVNYFKILPDGEEEPMNEEDATKTSQLIKQTIGSEDDFMMTILATAKNLEDLIDSTSTEKGKLITRFVGLEVIEEKEKIVRKMYNEFSKKMKSNLYNIIDLTDEITEHKDENITFQKLLNDNNTKLLIKKKELTDLDKEKEVLFGKKQEIDKAILKLSPNRLKEEISKITKDGVAEAKKLVIIKKDITTIGEVKFDEDNYHLLNKKKRELERGIDKDENEVERLEQKIKDLTDSEICVLCKRPLDDIDNSNDIDETQKLIDRLNKKGVCDGEDLIDINNQIEGMEENQKLSTNKAKLELQRDRIDVDLTSMRNDLKSLNNDMREYNLNLAGIEFNKKIESGILGVNSKIQMSTIDKDKYISNIERIKADIKQNDKDIETKGVLIINIKKEQLEEKNYKVYIEMVGKKGIGKIVLRSVLPIINSELHRLLDDVTDFDVEMIISDKNDIEFYLIKDGVSKKLKSGSGLERTTSALALRFVLSQISSLPKPNFIAFDEIFGKIASENLESVRLLFDKASEMFETIFIITHIDIIKDWANKLIVVEKKDNVSNISVI